jgi:hypothetical protein
MEMSLRFEAATIPLTACPRYRPGSFPGECPTPGWHDEFETVSTTLLAFTFSGYNVREVSTSAGYLDE